MEGGKSVRDKYWARGAEQRNTRKKRKSSTKSEGRKARRAIKGAPQEARETERAHEAVRRGDAALHLALGRLDLEGGGQRRGDTAVRGEVVLVGFILLSLRICS